MWTRSESAEEAAGLSDRSPLPGILTSGACLSGPATRRSTPLVLGHVGLALGRRHLVEQDVGALQRVALDVLQLPHLLRIQIEMRLRDERLAVVTDIAEVLDDLGEILAVVHRLPLAVTGEAAHRRRR